MAHTTRYGNTYTDQEWKEVQDAYREEGEAASRWFQVKEESISRSAQILHKEFSDVPVATWKAGLNSQYDENPREIQFTSSAKKERFEAAAAWVWSQLKKVG